MPTKIVSHYTPLTYDEITKPLIQATQAQMAVEDAYMAASDKAAQALAQANEQTDPTAYRKLKSYADDLKSQADALAQYGLQKSSRQSLLNMRRRYGQEITPIDTAIARRSALMEEQRQARLKNPYLMYERDMGTVSLDDLISNPNLDYGKSINGEDIMKRAASITKAFGQAVQDISNGKQIDKYTKELLVREGFTPAQIMAAVNGDGSALAQALEGIYSSSGADAFSTDDQNRVRGYIQEGAMMGQGSVRASAALDREAARRDQLSDRANERNWQLKMHGLKMENGHIVIDEESPLYTPKSGRATTVNGETITIASVGPNTKSYGTIGKTNDGQYYRRVGSKWEFIDDQETAGRLFTEGEKVATEANLTPTQQRQRQEFGSVYGGVARIGKDVAEFGDDSFDETIADIQSALIASDTDYYTAQNVPNRAKFAELIKDTGYGMDDFYFIYNRNGRNHWNIILKSVAKSQIPSLASKYSSTTTATTTSQSGTQVIEVPDYDVNTGLDGSGISMTESEREDAANVMVDAMTNYWGF